MSDWGGTNSTSDSLTAGLDLEMPGPTRWRALEQVKEALSSGETTEDAINARCRNVLELLVKTGSFADPKIPDEQAIDSPEHRALIREVGRSGVVLLKNEGSLLPLKKEMLKGKTVLMAGLAKEALIHGGGSASVNSHYRVSPWDALSMAFGKDIKLQYAKGMRLYRPLREPTLYLCLCRRSKLSQLTPNGGRLHAGARINWQNRLNSCEESNMGTNGFRGEVQRGDLDWDLYPQRIRLSLSKLRRPGPDTILHR